MKQRQRLQQDGLENHPRKTQRNYIGKISPTMTNAFATAGCTLALCLVREGRAVDLQRNHCAGTHVNA